MSRTTRLIGVTAGFAVLAAVSYLLLIGLGPLRLSPWQVIDVLTGGGSSRAITVVWDLRLPVAIAAVIVGAGLGVAGAWTQTMSRNPLASPDILGVSGGAAVFVVAGTVVTRPALFGDLPTVWWRALFALAGAAVIVVLLVALGGFGTSQRIVVVGFALSLMCHALVSYLLVRADITRAADAQTWLAGSTGFVRADMLPALCLGIAPFAVLGLLQWRTLPLLAHNDEVVSSLGVSVSRVRARLLIAATGIVAVIVALVGPIGFIALLAPQLARLVARTPTPHPLASAAAGSALLTGCAVIAALLPASVPVGVVSAAIGGVGLLILVLRSATLTRKELAV